MPRIVHPEQTRMQRRVLIATSISSIVVILDTSIVNIALDRIGDTLSVGISGLQWVVNAYTLAFACLLLTGGTLGDRCGARRIYLAGLAVFTLASMLCGIAPTWGALTAARILQGMGAAMLMPSSLTLLNRAYGDPGERASAIGVWVGCGGAALAAGPLAGGVLIGLLGWRSIFLVNLPIGAVGMWLAAGAGRDASPAQSRHVDFAGQAAAIVALGASIATFIEGPALGWGSPAILGGFAASVVAWAAFLAIEARRAQPMLPLALFRNRTFSGSAIIAMAATWNLFGLIFVLSLYFQQVRGYSPMRAGLAFLPMTVVVAAVNVLSGRWARARGPRQPVLAGLACALSGLLGMLPVAPLAPYWSVGLPMLALGLGGGLIVPAVTAALIGSVAKDRAGIASGVLNAARQAGVALGVAVFGALLAMIHPFEAGMRTVLGVAAAIFLPCLPLAWSALGRRA